MPCEAGGIGTIVPGLFLKLRQGICYEIGDEQITDDYLAHWSWYWETIPKVQGSNPGLTTNL